MVTIELQVIWISFVGNKKATNRIKDQLDVQELERINKKG